MDIYSGEITNDQANLILIPYPLTSSRNMIGRVLANQSHWAAIIGIKAVWESIIVIGCMYMFGASD